MNLYVGKVEKAAAEALADQMGRSLSEELQWLLELGIQSAHHLPDKPDPEIHGDQHMRVNIYPRALLSNQIDRLKDSRNRLLATNHDLGRRWSRSSLCRALLEIGMRIERQLFNQVELLTARLATAAEVIDEVTLARYLFVRHELDDLEMMVNAPVPKGDLERWGLSEPDYYAAVNLAADLHYTWKQDG